MGEEDGGYESLAGVVGDCGIDEVSELVAQDERLSPRAGDKGTFLWSPYPYRLPLQCIVGRSMEGMSECKSAARSS